MVKRRPGESDPQQIGDHGRIGKPSGPSGVRCYKAVDANVVDMVEVGFTWMGNADTGEASSDNPSDNEQGLHTRAGKRKSYGGRSSNQSIVAV